LREGGSRALRGGSKGSSFRIKGDGEAAPVAINSSHIEWREKSQKGRVGGRKGGLKNYWEIELVPSMGKTSPGLRKKSNG